MKKKTEKEKKLPDYIDYIIPSWKIQRMVRAGEEFGVKFFLPPFDGDTSEAAFDIDEIKNKKTFKDFLSIIESLKVHYEYAFEGGKENKIFMAITVAKKRSK